VIIRENIRGVHIEGNARSHVAAHRTLSTVWIPSARQSEFTGKNSRQNLWRDEGRWRWRLLNRIYRRSYRAILLAKV